MPDAESSGRTVGQVGEDPLVADVISRYSGADWLTVGPGDDAAVLDLTGHFPGSLVVCTDTLVEGQDFRRDWSTAWDVGVKTAAQNFADIAAMGAHPHTLLISLTTPADVPAAWARDLADGLAAECARVGAVVAGGDLSAGTELSVTGTALGALSGPHAVLRSGARPGDIVAIAGISGRSAAGWALLRHGHGLLDGPPLPGALAGLVDDHRRPRPPYSSGPEAAQAGATAMIDTSDGLLRDADRVARASGVILDLDPAALQPDADLLAAAAFLGEFRAFPGEHVADSPGGSAAGSRGGLDAGSSGGPVADSEGEPDSDSRSNPADSLAASDPIGWVLTGGEDHALLACFPPNSVIPASFRRIGVVSEAPPGAPGAVLLGGRPIAGPGGWRHFA